MLSIYALKDPRTNEIRYIGKTSVGLDVRLRGHLHERKNTLKREWVKNLKSENLQPTIHLLEEIENVDALNMAEKKWIAILPHLGVKLTNETAGGDGFQGRHTNKSKEKMSRARKGRKQSKEHVQKRMEALRKTIQNPSYSNPHKGSRLSAEHRQKLSEAKKETWKTPDYRKSTVERLRRIASKGGSSLKLTASKMRRRQSTETIRKRVETRKRNKEMANGVQIG